MRFCSLNINDHKPRDVLGTVHTNLGRVLMVHTSTTTRRAAISGVLLHPCEYPSAFCTYRASGNARHSLGVQSKAHQQRYHRARPMALQSPLLTRSRDVPCAGNTLCVLHIRNMHVLYRIQAKLHSSDNFKDSKRTIDCQCSQLYIPL